MLAVHLNAVTEKKRDSIKQLQNNPIEFLIVSCSLRHVSDCFLILVGNNRWGITVKITKLWTLDITKL